MMSGDQRNQQHTAGIKESPIGKEINVMIVTFNMGNAKLDLPNILFNPTLNIDNEQVNADIVVIGLQESSYTNKHMPNNETDNSMTSGNVQFQKNDDNDSSSRKKDFKEKRVLSKEVSGLDRLLSPMLFEIEGVLGDNYYLVEHNKRVEMQLFVYAKNELQSAIYKVEKSAENTGFGHVFPNKGGVCISMIVNGTSLAFISCHLAAHEGVTKCKMRNDSVEEILGGARAGHKDFDVSITYHHTFLMGDLNYRITFDSRTPADLEDHAHPSPPSTAESINQQSKGNSESKVTLAMEEDKEDHVGDITEYRMTTLRQNNLKKVMGLIAEENWTELLKFDELTRELEAGRVLEGFCALIPNFPPTFKRIRGNGIRRKNSTSYSEETKGEDRDRHYSFALGVEEVQVMLDYSSSLPEEPSVDVTDYDDLSVMSGSTNMSVATGGASVTKPAMDSVSRKPKYYDPKRMPSYTDRILFNSLPGCMKHLKSLSFESFENVLSSDHKPVKAVFQIKTSGSSLYDPDDSTLQKLPFLRRVSSYNTKSNNTTSKLIPYITIGHLSAKGLTEMDSKLFGGGSDPYVRVTTEPPSILDPRSSCVRTKAIKHNLNPYWKECLKVKLRCNDLAELRSSAHILFSVWDHDSTNADDLIGTCVLSMADILESGSDNNCIDFKQPLLNNAKRQGVLSGRVQIQLGGTYPTLEALKEEIPEVNQEYVQECFCSVS